MDTSREYIDMCLMAREIQKLFIADKYILPIKELESRYDVRMWVKPFGIMTVLYDVLEVWLPRQDQLIELFIDNGFAREVSKSELFIDIRYHDNGTYSIESKFGVSKSFEQYWLRLYMIQCHLKLWDENQKTWIQAKNI